jgi:branched-subunit amino acid aminotransferase/4-amino-4-deoxychorismate lyase
MTAELHDRRIFEVFRSRRILHFGGVSSWLIEGDGEFLEDRGLTHGLGVFETMLVAGGQIFNSEAHRCRLSSGCEQLGMNFPDWVLIEKVIATRATEFSETRLRARLMRTAGAGSLDRLTGDKPQTVLTLVPWVEPPESLRVATAEWIRDERSPLTGVKCSSYAGNLIALQQAKEAGVDELMFANSRDEWCEGTTSNGFLVVDECLVTPSLDSGCLPGTMRAQILQWAGEMGIEAQERPVPMWEMNRAPEMFLTSAIRGVVPVVERGGMLQVGRITSRLRAKWRASIGLDGGK